MFEKRLALLDTDTLQSLKEMQRGVEKESLRIDPKGFLSQKPHPQRLGSALTHPFITTDYSEALLEFITPPFQSYQAPLQFLQQIHQYTYAALQPLDEKLWVNSMPCALTAEADIPIAYYGKSHTGQMKHIYRAGLGHRYGRTMQTIAGIHYNMSFPLSFWQRWHTILKSSLDLQTFINENYLSLIRNFRRHCWLLMYLLGASPAVCRSFFKEPPAHLELLTSRTVVAPYGTSLRMSDLGYQNSAQAQIQVNYNHLDNYIRGLCHAVDTPYPPFEAIGLKEGNTWKQLNTHILQIENEYYSVIRPKRAARKNERPLAALKNLGVEYIEVRCLDLNPFHPLGISAEQFYFLDLFCCFCLLEDSPMIEPQECQLIQQNFQEVVYQGRKPDLTLQQIEGSSVSLKKLGLDIFEKLSALAELFDKIHQTTHFSETVTKEKNKIENPDATPSAQVMQQLQTNDQCFFEFAMSCADDAKNYFHQQPLTAEDVQTWSLRAQLSLTQQQHIETTDTGSFEAFLAHYFAQGC